MSRPQSHGWRRKAAVVLLLLVATAAAGIGLSASSPTATDFARATLERLLGLPVELRAVEIRLGWDLEIELRGMRVLGADPAGSEPLLRVPVARGRLSWPRLLSGRLLPLDWWFDGPTLRLSGPLGEPGRPAAVLPPLDLRVRGGTLIWEPPEGEPFRVDRIELTASRAPLRRGVQGSAVGQVQRGARPLGAFALEFDGWLSGLDVRGLVQGLDLPTLWGGAAGAPESGVAAGSLDLRLAPGRVSGSADVEVREFRFDAPQLAAPIAPERLRLAADVEIAAGLASLSLRPLAAEDLSVSGSIELDRREGPPRLRTDLTVAPFRLGRPGGRLQLLRLLGRRHRLWADLDRRTEAGRIEDVRVQIDLPLARVSGVLGFAHPHAPDELHLSARVRDAVYRPGPDSEPLRDIEARFELIGDTLEFRDVHIRLREDRLPVISGRVDAMHRLAHLPAEERRVPAGPGVSIPGLGPAFAAFGASEEARETIVRLHDFAIGYPGFLLPFRDGEVVLDFPQGNLRVREALGVFGGRPARITGLWDRGASTIDVDVAYLAGEAPPPAPAPAGWASGEFSMDELWLGDWPFEAVEGRLRAEGARVELTDVTGALEGGLAEAQGYVSLDRTDHAPFGFVVNLTDADGNGMGQLVGLEDGTVSGRVQADGTLTGRLDPEREFLEDADIRMSASVWDGSLGNLPATVALARLTTPLGWTGLFGRPMVCDEMTADFTIARGLLRTENLAVKGPELRMLAAGEIDLLSEEVRTDAIVALLFLQMVDQVIEALPVVGSWMLGDDRNLVAIYFHLEGPWEDPSGSFVPPTAVQSATGWAGRVIGGGVRRIRQMLGARPPAAPPPPAALPAEPPDESTGGDGAGAGQDRRS